LNLKTFRSRKRDNKTKEGSMQPINLLCIRGKARVRALQIGLFIAMAMASSGRAALIGFYPFSPVVPTADRSGMGADLQSAGADPELLPTGGFEGAAYAFNGSQRWIAPIDINPGTLPVMTMGAWVKAGSLAPGLRKIMGSDDGGWDRTIGLDDREGPFRYTSFIGNGPPAVGGPGPISTNHWTFIAVSYDGNSGQLSLYVDEDAITSEPLSVVTVPAAFGSGFATTAIGGLRPDNAAEGWVGVIDNAFFYDEILTVERLTEIRDGGSKAILQAPPDDPNLLITSAPNLSNLSKVPSVKTLAFPIKNSGATEPLHITGVTLAGPDAGYYSVQTVVPATVPAGAVGAIEFQLDSRGQVGLFSATATVESDDPSTSSILLDLTARVVSTQTLLGLYSFDDPSNPLKDDSGGGKTLQNGLGGGAADPTYLPAGGFSGGAFEFGGSQRLAAPININPGPVPHLAMGAWVKTASLDPGLRKVIGHDDGAWDRTIGLDNRALAAGGALPDGTLRYAAFTGLNNFGPTQGDPPPTPTSTETWTFLLADYDQAHSRLLFYVDLDASTTDDDPQVIEQQAPMGTGANSVGIGAISSNGGEYWVGSIDNVFFISGAVDAATVRAVRDGGKQTLLQFGPDPVLVLPIGTVFGDLPDGSPKTVQVQIQNGGSSQPLAIASARVVGRDAVSYTLGAVPPTLAPGASASIAVTINPQRQGLLVASLELISNDSVERSKTINLSANVPFSDPQAALIGYYTFDDPADPLHDDSGHGNKLSLVPGAEPAYRPGDGFHDGGYEFTGVERLIAPININPTQRPILTMGAWIKASTLGGLHKVIGSDDGGWDRTIGMDDREGGLRYTTFVGNAAPLAGTPMPDSTEVWSFIAATYDDSASQVVMYVDLDASTTNDALVAVSGPTGFSTGFSTTAIGGLRPDNSNEGWIGLIDNAFFYEKVLTASELTNLRDREAAAANQLKIRSITRDAASVTITWRSQPGVFYSVEYKEKWEQPWVFLSVQLADGPTSSFTDDDPGRMAKPTGFYRVFTD
jgi:hypothetical protein